MAVAQLRRQNLLQETTDGAEWDYVYLEGMPITDLAGTGGTFELHTDAIDTVTRATNSGKGIVFTATYTPDGVATQSSSITMNLRLIGHYRDPDGDYHNGARNRIPTLIPGYLEHDPIGLAGGPNGYVFAGNNPVTYIDPSGLASLPGLLFGAVAAGVVGYEAGTKNRPAGALIGAVTGTAAFGISPGAAVAAGGGVRGFLVYEGINGAVAGVGTVATNLYNHDPDVLDDVPFAVTNGMGGDALQRRGWASSGLAIWKAWPEPITSSASTPSFSAWEAP